ncbi:glycoside hydrolase superfamily [Lipomyces orientalis]|uniref:Glycoside hydrolase superfamily n=1 Tax=Lipomyces orientalis TaxID=1233043 RepID=A0ACC3TSV5_9ASCO
MSPHSVKTGQSTATWWKDATVYQVYPASFKDSDGDGWGDIPGIISKVDYLNDLGVDVVWLSPMFDSPQEDMGYDISDYEAVYPRYGTVEDIDVLVRACHDRGMKLILDLVVNHTSTEHEWFKESRSSKTNPKRDWYFWRPPRYDEHGKRLPPTNYRSYFADSAWTWDETTQEYYLHLYAESQPDLNWENEETRNAIYDSAMRFWLDRGVDGFRVDTVNKYSKHVDFPDAPIVDPSNFIQPATHLYCNGPRIHEFIREMHDKVLSNYDVFTVGELSLTPDPKHVLKYVGASEKQLDMVFQFDMIHLGMGHGLEDKYEPTEWKLSEMKQIISKWQKFIEGNDGWTTAFCENHDNGRAISRFASDEPEFWQASAKMLTIFIVTLTGTLFLYQGQEIGMINMPSEWPIDEYKDIEALNYYKEAERLSNSSDPTRKGRIMQGLRKMARDHARLPMQWDSTPNGGFTTGIPWMRTHDKYKEINVEVEEKDPKSVLSFWKQLLALRKDYRDLFIYGVFDLVDPENEDTFMYTKLSTDDQVALVALNFSADPKPFTAFERSKKMKLLVGNYYDSEPETLQPFEGRVYLNF